MRIDAILGSVLRPECPIRRSFGDHGPESRLVGVTGGDDTATMLLVEHPRLVEEGSHHVLVVEHHVDVSCHETAQPSAAVPPAARAAIRRILEETRPLFHHFDEEVLFRLDMGVERGAEKAELATEVAHGRAVIAALGEEPSGGGHHVGTAVAGGDHQRWSYRTTTLSETGCDWQVSTYPASSSASTRA